MANDETATLYVLTSRIDRLAKIGKVEKQSVLDRKHQIENNSGRRLRVEATMEGSRSAIAKAERQIHQHLRAHRADNGEWFRITEELETIIFMAHLLTEITSVAPGASWSQLDDLGGW